MALTTPSRQLCRDLREVIAILKWSGVDLMEAAVRLSEADADAHRLVKSFFKPFR